MNKNAAFVGGGVSTVCGLGAYYVATRERNDFTSFSGASIGSIVAIALAAGQKPSNIYTFLCNNVKDFCQPIIGKSKIRKRTNEFLCGIRFKDLPYNCIVSVTKFGEKTPVLITRENSGELTVGEVAALSSTLPGLYLPSRMKDSQGRKFFVLDGGMTANPPLVEDAKNTIFTFNRVYKKTSNSIWSKRKLAQEAQADSVIKIPTVTSTRGDYTDVITAWTEGVLYMSSIIK